MSKKLTHEEFINKLKKQNKYFANEKFTVTGEYVSYTNKISCKCHLGHTWMAKPAHLLCSDCGCPYCCGNTILAGFNDLWTARPDVAKLLKNYSDGYKFGQYSNQKVEFVCPNCGCVIMRLVRDVSKQGLSCSMCADGVSYPNKFGRALLKQLPIENFKCEYSPKWAHPYRYDNYFEYKGQAYILEMDGAFHYEEKAFSKLSLEDRIQIDNIKTEMANKQGIIVIRIDCRVSDFNYIKTSIMNSELNNLFDLSLINWDMCNIASCNSLVKAACDLYVFGMHETNMIGRVLCISSKAVLDYLKRGTKIGWCDYNAKRAIQRRIKSMQKPIAVTDLDGNTVHTFDSAKICANELSCLYNAHMCYDNILKACRNGKPYKGFKFEYINVAQHNDFKEVFING